MTYPIIMNGDHAAFEIEHANTPPKERPDWPLPSFDARDWAEAFCKRAREHGDDPDEGWMITWFANALMRGYDERSAQVARPLVERDMLYGHVNGLLGLLQLLRGRDDIPDEVKEIMRTNHRATDAAAYLTQIVPPDSHD